VEAFDHSLLGKMGNSPSAVNLFSVGELGLSVSEDIPRVFIDHYLHESFCTVWKDKIRDIDVPDFVGTLGPDPNPLIFFAPLFSRP
jgi:hypothetical protein